MTCPTCKGEGEIHGAFPSFDGLVGTVVCPQCNGAGEVDGQAVEREIKRRLIVQDQARRGGQDVSDSWVYAPRGW